MYKYLLLISLFFTTLTYSQTVNDQPLSEIDVDYVQIVGTSKLLSQKLTIEIDFGQENRLFKSRDTQLKDETGKNLVFNSMIDALNFMSRNGYEFIDAYTLTQGNNNVYHYLLKRQEPALGPDFIED